MVAVVVFFVEVVVSVVDVSAVVAMAAGKVVVGVTVVGWCWSR